MIQVTRDEAMELRKKLPKEHVTMTNRQSKAKARTYYVNESYAVKHFLEEIRKSKAVEHFE